MQQTNIALPKRRGDKSSVKKTFKYFTKVSLFTSSNPKRV